MVSEAKLLFPREGNSVIKIYEQTCNIIMSRGILQREIY